MRLARPAAIGLVLALAAVPGVHAAMPAVADTEIDALLGFVEASGCGFYRNGMRYDGEHAAAHLRDKARWLAAHDRIATAEDFIREAATASSLTGRPYEVRCLDQVPMPSRQWLCEELGRYRKKGAARDSRAAPDADDSAVGETISRPCGP